MPKPEELVVSRWLKKELNRKGITASELAAKVADKGITRSAVYYYVSGERIPSKEVAEKLAKELGSTVPEYTMKKVGRPKKVQKTKKQLINEVIRSQRESAQATE